ncbi:MAG: hypothetical protein MUE51_03435 [Thermoleophilia bacterium]|nr:hypothetical protein [Thermoleophilia bacterium]
MSLHRWSPADREMPGLEAGEHVDLLTAALVTEADAQRRLLEGDPEGAAPVFRAAAAAYRASFAVAPPRSYGRLVGMLKAAVIGGGGEDAAAHAREHLPAPCDSPAACYALALAAAVLGDRAALAEGAAGMRGAGDHFARVADALEALADGRREAYGAALLGIVADFEGREEHLTGVAIADTAVMLEALAGRAGMALGPRSRVLPPRG